MSTEPAIIPRQAPADADPIEAALHRLKGRTVRVCGMKALVFIQGELCHIYTASKDSVWTVSQDGITLQFDRDSVARVAFGRIHLRRASR